MNPPRPARARWGILAVYALLSLILQLQWLTFAPIAREAQAVYGATPFQIDLLSLIFMAVFVVACLPASYFIDRFGLRVGIGLGAVLTGGFGMLKGFGATSYPLVVVAQVGLALAQPLVANSVTKLAANWFPATERATAVGLATLAQFIGIIVAMIVTPTLVGHEGAVPDLGSMLLIYGALSAGAALLVLAFLRDRPAGASQADADAERLVAKGGMRTMWRQRDTRLILGIFAIGLGVFNAVSTCIDQLCADKHLDLDQTGLVGGIMFIAGVIGAAFLPIWSDRRRQRRPFLIAALALTGPALAALMLADGFVPLLIASGVLGLFLLGAGAPIGFQYAAEVSHPVPEATSQGLILLVGQVSGIIFIVAINLIGIIPLMGVFVGLALVATALTVALRESPRMQS